MGLTKLGTHKLLHHQRLSQFFQSTSWPHWILGGRCWAANRWSHHSEPSGRAIHGEVDGLNIEGQHGRRFVLLRHTLRPQRGPYPICTRRGNARRRCGSGWAGPRLSVAHPRIFFRGNQSPDVRPIVSSVYFQTIENWYDAPVKILTSLFRRVTWPLRPHSGCDTARCSWQWHSRRDGRGWKYGVS